ncbi:MAG TPA: hypothetical protein VMV44_03655 [Rectinemataceae bacterium]|nr:hypothetical protein [Rectinemataceae bacterium]
MKRLLVFAVAALAPAILFAQVPADRGSALYKRMGLTDSQVAQVTKIMQDTETVVRDARIHVRLLKAQIDEAILPSSAKPDMEAIGKLVDQESQIRATMEKSLLSAEVQLIQIMGRDNFERYFHSLMRGFAMGEGRDGQVFRGRPMQGRGPLMGGFVVPQSGGQGAAPSVGSGSTN